MTYADQISRAVHDPGAVAGRRRGPSWGRGNDGYAKEQETLWEWVVRAVLATRDHELETKTAVAASNKAHTEAMAEELERITPWAPTGTVRLNDGRPEMWDPSVPPGGWVCAVPSTKGLCGIPVESEPCTEHYPAEADDSEPFDCEPGCRCKTRQP